MKFSISAGLFVASLCLLLGASPKWAGATAPSVRAEVMRAPETVAAIPAAAKPAAAAAPLIGVQTVDESGISPEVLNMALDAVSCATASGALEAPPTLTVIDYSLPSVEPRLWVFDLETGDLLFKELVAHGRNTGENMAVLFSNRMNSRQSSLGLFVTDEPYVGSNGYSLRLDGLDIGFNDRARERAIVMHGAPYVSEEFAARQGRIGRSWGCPALPRAAARPVIDRIRGGSAIFAYYPEPEWLASSRFLKGCSATS